MVERDGIHIPGEVARAEAVPEDLDAGRVRPYRFPDPSRRRAAGWIYLVGAAGLAVLALDTPGMWFGVAVCLGLTGWSLQAGWPLAIDQERALETAARMVPFPVGHASAAVTFHGIRSRPRWHVIVYSADQPPSQRALVQLDAVTGRPVEEVYVEAVPEA